MLSLERNQENLQAFMDNPPAAMHADKDPKTLSDNLPAATYENDPEDPQYARDDDQELLGDPQVTRRRRPRQ